MNSSLHEIQADLQRLASHQLHQNQIGPTTIHQNQMQQSNQIQNQLSGNVLQQQQTQNQIGGNTMLQNTMQPQANAPPPQMASFATLHQNNFVNNRSQINYTAPQQIHSLLYNNSTQWHSLVNQQQPNNFISQHNQQNNFINQQQVQFIFSLKFIYISRNSHTICVQQ